MIKKLILLIGVRRMLKAGWSMLIYPELKKLAARSDSEVDDDLVSFLNGLIPKIIDRL